MESHKVELFVERLAVALQEKFKGHWYPKNPSRGQAYRCIRVNRFHRQDPDLLRACRESGVQYSDLGLPRELTLWVDPGEVCCRYGEQNPCFSVASFSNDNEEDKDVAKKVTSALERVTSDYHSGSSSDEESVRSSPLTVPSSRCAHQVLQLSLIYFFIFFNTSLWKRLVNCKVVQMTFFCHLQSLVICLFSNNWD